MHIYAQDRLRQSPAPMKDPQPVEVKPRLNVVRRLTPVAPRRRNGVITPEIRSIITERWGEKLSAIAKEVGISEAYVSLVGRRMGLPSRKHSKGTKHE